MRPVERGKGYHARILLDSVAPSGARLTTFELRYPRFVHSELLTHRLFSRNSASSRAIPTERLLAQVLEEPALPVFWGRNQAGMQARQELSDGEAEVAQHHWLLARDRAAETVQALAGTGLHKQLANRLIEPWMFITVIVSATEYDNWFGLRDHAAAQPEIAFIAAAMRKLYESNEPRPLQAGDWHLPLVDRWAPGFQYNTDTGERFDLEVEGYTIADLKRISAGRCARVSYLTHDGRRDPRADIDLAEKLSASGHWSPFEHVAQAQEIPRMSGNFVGWWQFRKEFQNEHIGGPRV